MRLAFKVLIGVFLVLVGVFGYSMWAMTVENPSSVNAINPQSNGPKTLVISDPASAGSSRTSRAHSRTVSQRTAGTSR